MSTLNVEITIQRKGRPKAVLEPLAPRISRLTRLMALAIRFQDMVDRREVRDYAEIARLGYVTRARLSQIMNLLLLAPDIQEEVLGMEGQASRSTEVPERDMRRKDCPLAATDAPVGKDEGPNGGFVAEQLEPNDYRGAAWLIVIGGSMKSRALLSRWKLKPDVRHGCSSRSGRWSRSGRETRWPG
jgi:hypothetical protein